MKVCSVLLIIVFNLTTNIFPQDLSIDTTIHITAEEWDESEFWYSEPLSNLPKHIPIYDEVIYLYADFSNIVNNTIQVYLINNSKKKFKYNGYLWSLLQKEFKDTNNTWTRINYHFYGWCGTGYIMEYGIRPGEFIVFENSIPDEGEEHEVRYHFYTTDVVTSNLGIIKINKDEVEEAKYDDIALQINGANFLVQIIKGEIAPFDSAYKNENLIWRAIPVLSFNYPEEAIPILESIANDSLNKFQRQAIANLEGINKRKQK